MKLTIIDEPLLEFGSNAHICPRAGITKYGVYDTRLKARRDKILIGAVGTSDDLERLGNWLSRCSQYIPPKKDNRKPELYPGFCGFNLNTGFQAKIAYEQEITRPLNLSDIRQILKIKDWNTRVDAAVEMYYRQIKFLAQNRVVDVIICVIPTNLYEKISRKDEVLPSDDSSINETDESDSVETNFRRALKAKAMHLGRPIQIMRGLSLESNPASQQDDATKAWNFSVALYYKANQTVPWKLVSNVNRPSICFVGIGFYRSRDKKSLHTSLAQIFDELGNGVILRGTPILLDKDDRVPHLSASQSFELLNRALIEYEIAMETSPARLVIHKSSNFDKEEVEGFKQATKERRIKSTDLVAILDTQLKVLRDGIYPPYRGTYIELNEQNHLLYTRGGVKYYQTYTGRYVPQPIEVRIIESDESPGQICKEILGLTKMNWNNTQFDGRLPITISCARKVGEIMKYVDENEKPQIRYSFYM